LRLVVRIRRNGSGWSATLDSVDQYVHDFPIDDVAFDGGEVTLTLLKLHGIYRGRLEGGDRLDGTWTQNGTSTPLVLEKTATPAALVPRFQEPKRPLPYDEIEMTVDNPVGHDALACTLTKPRGPGPFAAVALLTGSGPQNRDEALMGHRPFLVLSDAITRKGVAVLRCDDRGIAKSTGDFQSATTFDFVGDALAQVAALRARGDIDPAHVGLLGQSEGGVVAPMAAAESKDVAFVVLLAGTALPGEQILQLQAALISKAAGQSDAEIAQRQAVMREVYAVIETEKDDAAVLSTLRARLEALPEAERMQWQRQRESVEASLKLLLSPWFRTFLTLDPRTYLARVKVPVLALNGERDLQVPPRENLPEMRKALAGNPDVTIRELPGLNHLFQTCQTGAPGEYAEIGETMSPVVLATVSDWIVLHAR
jgi:pimeloyl-ACP methyl ester carboxylesterase